MTLDKIIQGLKAVRTIHNGNYTPQIDSAIHILKHLKTELEPCDDCVSREAAINVIYDYTYKKDMRRAIEQLPSVKPQRPKGKWIEQNDTSKHHFGWYYCSNCGAYLMSADGVNYCSCCGSLNGGKTDGNE